jgi:hypothetical protein
MMVCRLIVFFALFAVLFFGAACEQQFPDQRTYDPSPTGTNSLAITIRNYPSHIAGVPLRFKAANDNTGGGTSQC